MSKGLEAGNLEDGPKRNIPRGLVYRGCGAKKVVLLHPRGPFHPSSVSQLPLSTSALLSSSAFRSVSSIILEASEVKDPIQFISVSLSSSTSLGWHRDTVSE